MEQYRKWQKVCVYDTGDMPMADEKEVNYDEHHALIADGFIKVQAYTARRAYPVSNVKVEVSKTINNEKYLRSLSTNTSGSTEVITVPAPPKYLSTEPGFAHPYASYSIKVTHHDYTVVEYDDVRVFDGVVSLLEVDLLPLKLAEIE